MCDGSGLNPWESSRRKRPRWPLLPAKTPQKSHAFYSIRKYFHHQNFFFLEIDLFFQNLFLRMASEDFRGGNFSRTPRKLSKDSTGSGFRNRTHSLASSSGSDSGSRPVRDLCYLITNYNLQSKTKIYFFDSQLKHQRRHHQISRLLCSKIKNIFSKFSVDTSKAAPSNF